MITPCWLGQFFKLVGIHWSIQRLSQVSLSGFEKANQKLSGYIFPYFREPIVWIRQHVYLLFCMCVFMFLYVCLCVHVCIWRETGANLGPPSLGVIYFFKKYFIIYLLGVCTPVCTCPHTSAHGCQKRALEPLETEGVIGGCEPSNMGTELWRWRTPRYKPGHSG